MSDLADFPGAPHQLPPGEEPALFAKLRAARDRFAAKGGTFCHCGGFIYPLASGEKRHTCTHGGVPLTSSEIAAVVSEWDRQDAEASNA